MKQGTKNRVSLWFSATRAVERSLVSSLGLKCVVISALLFVLLYLFIAALMWTINLTCLPKETRSPTAGFKNAPASIRFEEYIKVVNTV